LLKEVERKVKIEQDQGESKVDSDCYENRHKTASRVVEKSAKQREGKNVVRKEAQIKRHVCRGGRK
jgi:hypothetical protein